MNSHYRAWFKAASRLGGRSSLIGFLVFILVLSSCTNAPTQDASLVDTMTAQGVKATVDAQLTAQSAQATTQSQQEMINAQATILAQNATQLAQLNQAPTVDLQATQSALQSQAAMVEQQATQAALQVEQHSSAATAQASAATAEQQPTPTLAEPTPDLAALMKSANILLYEDIIFRSDTIRYVRKTLDRMGLPYTDVGSAVGRLKSQLLSGGPKGEGRTIIRVDVSDRGLEAVVLRPDGSTFGTARVSVKR